MITDKKCQDCPAFLHHNNRSGYCRTCYEKNRTKMRRDSPEHRQYLADYRAATKMQKVDYQRQRKYGISPEAFYKMLREQNYACYICERRVDELANPILHIDHDHKCCPSRDKTCGSCVRKLLCRGCNFALGYFEDNVDVIKKAIVYLQS